MIENTHFHQWPQSKLAMNAFFQFSHCLYAQAFGFANYSQFDDKGIDSKSFPISIWLSSFFQFSHFWPRYGLLQLATVIMIPHM